MVEIKAVTLFQDLHHFRAVEKRTGIVRGASNEVISLAETCERLFFRGQLLYLKRFW